MSTKRKGKGKGKGKGKYEKEREKEEKEEKYEEEREKEERHEEKENEIVMIQPRFLVNIDPLKTLASSVPTPESNTWPYAKPVGIDSPLIIIDPDVFRNYPTQEEEINKLKKSGLYEKYLKPGRDISEWYRIDPSTGNTIIRRFERGTGKLFGNIDTISLPFLEWDHLNNFVGFIFPTKLGFIGPFYYHTYDINNVHKLMEAIDNFYRYPLQDQLIEFFFGPEEEMKYRVREVAKDSSNKWVNFDWDEYHKITKNLEFKDWNKYPIPGGNWVKPYWLGSYFLETIYDVSPEFMYLELFSIQKGIYWLKPFA